MITAVWYESVNTDAEPLIITDDPETDEQNIAYVPAIGESVGFRPMPDAPEGHVFLDKVVDVRTFLFKDEDGVWKQEVHVMTEASR